MKNKTKISINGAFTDCIGSILHYKDMTIPDYYKTKEVVKGANSNDKKEIIELFKSCIDFFIEDNEIIFTIKRSELELNEYLEEKKQGLKYELNKLKKWFDLKEENKVQITTYLRYKKLDFILTELETN